MTARRRGSVRRDSPRRKRAPPTPPASTVIVVAATVSPDPPVQGGALDRYAAHAAHQRLDLLHRRVLPGVRASLARDALLHQRAAEVVAPRAKRALLQGVPQLYTRR